jgi:[NiFe] hydrogenase assembly HybE family chaperone
MSAYFEEDPGQAVEAAFRKIEGGAMDGLPICHAGLTSEWVGGRRWGEYWLGCLITPWTLQLLLLPATAAAESLREGDVRVQEFPQGPLTFRAIESPDLGTYQSCGLCSPVTGYPSQEAIRQVSAEVMELLFEPPTGQAVAGPTPLESGAPAYTRRDILRGGRR